MSQPDPGTKRRSGRTAALDLGLADLGRILFQRRWVAAGAAAVVLGAGLLFTWRAPRIYRATATVVIDRAPPQVLADVRDVVDLGSTGFWSAQEYQHTQYGVLSSRPVAHKAAARLGLDASLLGKQLRLAIKGGDDRQLLPLDSAIDRKLRLLGLDSSRAGAELIAQLAELDVPAALRRRVSITPVEKSQLVSVAVEDRDPGIAATLTNAIVDSYIEFNLEQKTEATRAAVDWLASQEEELSHRLETSETALQRFREGNRLAAVTLPERRTMVVDTLSRLNQALTDARARRLTLESHRARLAAASRGDALPDSLQEATAHPLIQSLKSARSQLRREEAVLLERYTEHHPALVAIRKQKEIVEQDLTREVGKIVEGLKQEITAAADAEHRLAVSLEEVKDKALLLSKSEIDHNRLERERDNNQALYELVVRRHKEADLSHRLEVNNVRRLEAATTPQAPIRPRVRLNLALSLFLAILASAAAALVADRLDNTVKERAQVEERLGLAFLGVLPRIRGPKRAKVPALAARDLFSRHHPRSNIAECCRTLRTNILFMTPEAPVRRLLITSSNPEEGKSTVAINLAMTMAQAGARTLLMDTDLRRPRLHTSFGLDKGTGLTGVILGEVAPADAIRSTDQEQLDILTSGPVPPNPTELLHSKPFTSLVAELGDRYDRLLFDSPPVRAVSDAMVLSAMMDGTLLVIEAGQTTFAAAAQAKRLLEDVGAKVFGAVLNNVGVETGADGYYYSFDPSKAQADDRSQSFA